MSDFSSLANLPKPVLDERARTALQEDLNVFTICVQATPEVDACPYKGLGDERCVTCNNFGPLHDTLIAIEAIVVSAGQAPLVIKSRHRNVAIYGINTSHVLHVCDGKVLNEQPL